MDMEKVIHGLELVKEDIREMFTSGSQTSVDCLRIDKAIALLKEQEAVKPILTPWRVNDDGEVTVYKMECGKCGVQFYYEDQKYCSECGTPILWESR